MMIPKKVVRVTEIAVFFEGEMFAHGHPVDEKAVVTINGQTATIADIKPDDMVALDGQPAVVVEATRPGEFHPKREVHATPAPASEEHEETDEVEEEPHRTPHPTHTARSKRHK